MSSCRLAFAIASDAPISQAKVAANIASVQGQIAALSESNNQLRQQIVERGPTVNQAEPVTKAEKSKEDSDDGMTSFISEGIAAVQSGAPPAVEVNPMLELASSCRPSELCCLYEPTAGTMQTAPSKPHYFNHCERRVLITDTCT